MLTQRGRLALALAGGLYACAWAFGATILYPVAIGLALAVGVAAAWVSLSPAALRFHRQTREREHEEGDDVRVELELELGRGVRPPALTLRERLGRLGERFSELTIVRGRALGGYVLARVPRGRYPLAEATLLLEDPFGLARRSVTLTVRGALLVYPRLVELDGLFSERGAAGPEGRHLRLRQPAGLELHSVREYQQGESLRKVHWRSTARRGQLMVKDLEDPTRDEVAVVLDAQARTSVGEPPDSSFDLQVRAAGSILRAQAKRERRSLLVVHGATLEEQRVQGLDGDWHRALELLASAEPTAHEAVSSMLGDGASASARALDLVVVTATATPALVDLLAQRVRGQRASLVYVDPTSFANRAPSTPLPALLRLQGAGVAVAVLRRGDDLAAVLGGAAERSLAHA